MLRQIKSAALDIFPEVVRLRREIHANPELSFEEQDTARLVQSSLGPLGMPLQTGVAKTGVVATLRGGLPGPTLVLRADMDALPILEDSGVSFPSKNPGKMHACGHDAHTASLIGTALILHGLRENLPGAVRFVFQPSEERLPGGAQAMVREGVLREAAAAYAQHVMPSLPAGAIGFRSGIFMASADELYITVRGQGGHAAAPHKLPTDTVLAASHIVVALQSVISRHCPPDVPSVLSFGKVLGEGATNVIPSAVRLEGTLRAMSEEWRARAHSLIRRVTTSTARAYGASADLEIRGGYPALYNDPALVTLAREAAIEYVGRSLTVDLDLWFASEDFAYFLQNIPGALYLLGVGDAREEASPALHSPQFIMDESALRTGSGFMAFLAWRCLSQGVDAIRAPA